MTNVVNKKTTRLIFGFLTVVALFILTSFFSQVYESEIHEFILHDSVLGKLIYILITIVAVVLAPISTIPLLPVASHLWGWIMAGVLSVIGWVIGAQIAFLLARRLGRPFIERIFSFEKINAFENYFTDKNLFWTVVFLRVITPVDVLSYALGLFSKIKSPTFFFATFIGVIPFAFIFSYAGNLPSRLQIVIFLEIIAFLGILYIVQNAVKNRKS